MKLLIVTILFTMACTASSPSFSDFDRKARAGAKLNVVFFGASLTWGANSTDPNLTSYRADTARALERRYPRAHFKFWDAAIGGTGSQLAIFRLDRDVLSRSPDLVFLDFSANDDIYSADKDTLSSYEAMVRKIISIGRAPVVQMLFPFAQNIKAGELERMKRREAHLKISLAYHTAVGDAIKLALERVRQDPGELEELWPIDGSHPGDHGYALFAEAAMEAFDNAVRRRVVCEIPSRMIYGGTYITATRARISKLGELPSGWRVGAPNHTSAYFDMFMTRWLDDEVITSTASRPEPLRVHFRASMVMLFGESTPTSGGYTARIDGHPVRPEMFEPGSFAIGASGNVHLVQVLATGLDPAVSHTLEIEPLFRAGSEEELRLESICVAGGAATVWK
jgi:lysophospholipase L1-like esterase